jgi:hypothetical protein
LGRRVTYSVHFEVDLGAVPDGPRQEIRRTVQQIADVVSTIPGSSPFWSSMKESLLQVDVQGWRLVYRVLPDRREIRVIELEALRR